MQTNKNVRFDLIRSHILRIKYYFLTISKMKMTIKVRKTNKKEKIEFLIGTFIIILVILGFKIMK
ncbi:hypothetical protein SASK131_01260 [Staphylococcus argenteus]|nr:hypothetical protein TMSFP069_11730 [Staphylococcus argenteus]GJF40881.1 hypothetical protein SA19059_05330 [Staphylococcus argenteus]GJF66743.1 hypothetical protein SA19136_04910 [Staphylococcus argenteus]